MSLHRLQSPMSLLQKNTRFGASGTHGKCHSTVFGVRLPFYALELSRVGLWQCDN